MLFATDRTGRGFRQWLLLCAATIALSACQNTQNIAQLEAGPTPDIGVVAMTVAEAADRAGDTASALDLYGQAIAEGKASPRAYLRRGEIFLTMGRAQDASAVFQQAMQAGIDTPDIRRGHARALLGLGQAEAALREYDLLLVGTPTDAKAMNGRGVALDILERHADAQLQYKAAAASAPGDLSIQNNLALSYALTGRTAEAIEILEHIDAAGASTMQHRQNLALLYGLTGQVALAEALAVRDLGAAAARNNLDIYARMHHLLSEAEASQSLDVVKERTNAAAAQAWVVDLGAVPSPEAASERWSQVRRAYPEAFAGLAYSLEREQDGNRLIAGPVWMPERAREICDTVRSGGGICAARLATPPPPA
jgi:Flp pilus assembly protein TadD